MLRLRKKVMDKILPDKYDSELFAPTFNEFFDFVYQSY